MPVFVHLTSERNLASIRRCGIALRKRLVRPAGVYAMPVTRDFSISHQWLREMKRAGGGTIVGVYFRLPDDEPVRVGHFGSPLVDMTAAEAVALMMEAERRDPAAARAVDERAKKRRRGANRLPTSPQGYEVVIPRRIERSEILRVKALPQVVGWRYRPGSNGQAPCLCLCCERGAYGVRRMLRAVEEAEAAGREHPATVFGRDDASFERVETLRARRRRKG